ncbi:2,3-butanediol dehydrogenase [Natronorubrum halophilum]|uniref:2,3-butanediol dehydrogenase n=1 Tax=Natronorubrum halophilum TaxID=1702106 RepID=UPI000EF712CD|nr:2,3-butanediol dehydrogenase [Natronorubrum halophilum]
MRAARYYGPRDVRVEEIEPETVGANDVRVEVAACGICGSDLHEYAAGPITIPEAPHPVTGDAIPITIGHEIGGTIVETGADVALEEGTNVAVNPIVWCGDCQYCDEGNYHLCQSGGFVGLSGGGGGFSENVVVSAETVVPVPDDVPAELAALVEPFTVGVHAVEQSGLGPGDTAAVFGSGPIGLTVLQAALAAGAGPVYVSEPLATRRTRAADCGADVTIDPSDGDPVSSIRDETGGVDVAFEVAGVEQSLNQALSVTRSGGTTTIVSLFEDSVSIEPTDIVVAERTVVGTAAFEGGPLSDREFGTTVRNFATGDFDPESLVTSRIDLEDIVEDGFETLIEGESDEVKILVRP